MAALIDQEGLPDLPDREIDLGDGVHVMVDGAAADKSVLVEAYARQGTLRGAQLKKVAQDILKLATIRDRPDYAQARAIIVFASEAALDSVRGWLRRAAEQQRVELLRIELDDDTRAAIERAQSRQVMVNLDLVSSDVAEPTGEVSDLGA